MLDEYTITSKPHLKFILYFIDTEFHEYYKQQNEHNEHNALNDAKWNKKLYEQTKISTK